MELSQCHTCIHLLAGEQTCAAYPDGIPRAIKLNRADHTKPQPGDHGIQWAPAAPGLTGGIPPEDSPWSR